jgi:hypothetical protein
MYEQDVAAPGSGWLYHLTFNLFHGLGWPLLFSSLAGIVVLFYGNWRNGLILCSFPVIYYVVIGKGYNVFARYTVPIVPFLCITGSIFASAILNKLDGLFRHRFGNILSTVVPLLIILPSAENVIQFDRLMTKEDNRLIARRWVHENVPKGSSIYQWGRTSYGNVQLRPTLDTLKKGLEKAVTEGRQGTLYRAAIEHWKEHDIQGYEPWVYDVELGEFKFVDEVTTGWPHFIMVLLSPLGTPTKPEQIQGALMELYQLERRFLAGDIGQENNLYDKQDAFYVPFAGFEGVERPGPNISVYSRK